MPLFATFSKALDFILPPRCVSCQQMVLETKTLCADCWEEANFITTPFCSCCGLPFEFDVPDGVLCLECTKHRPPFHTARSVFPYDDFSRKLILSFKHGDRTDLAPTFAAWMVRAVGPVILKRCDTIIPVPLHWRRLGYRRYNQASLLAHEISKLTSLKTEPYILKRTRHTPPQGHLARMARQKNLQGAFKVNGNLQGKSILLIDDVLTTGATLLNCTRALLNAGAKEVNALTLARVIQNRTQ